jgi:branched-chain amino acid transport system permease protein
VGRAGRGRVITVLKQWLQDILPKVFGSAGNFEVIVFGVMVIVLQRARDGLWPLLAGWCRCGRAQAIDPPPPLPKKPQPPMGETILEANVTRKFGGLVANNNMSLS